MTNTSQQSATERHRLSSIRQLIRRAMDHDRYAIVMEYTDFDGTTTVRTVSPTQIYDHSRDLFRAMCLCREGYRDFRLSRIKNIKLIPASEVLAPVEIREVGDE